MNSVLVGLCAVIASSFWSRAALQTEILALRHQLAVLQANAPRRLRLKRSDRVLWVLLSRFWSGWRRCLQMVQPATVIAWHRRAFGWYWTWKSRRPPGRSNTTAEIRDLIRRMSHANPLWGAPPRSRGTPKVGNRGGAIDGGQVSATAPEAAPADLANVPDQSLAKDAPQPRAVEKAEQGPLIAIPQVVGLHHRYQRRAA